MVEDAGELRLPEPFSIASFDGSVQEWVQRCRWQLEQAVDGHIELQGRPVLPAGDIDKLFWHVATGAHRGSQERWLDPRRCALMGLVWDILERLAVGDPRAVSWREKRHYGHKKGKGRRTGTRLMVAPVDFSFAAILREGPEHVFLGTAYPLGEQSSLRAMRKAAGGDLLPMWELPKAAGPLAADNGLAGLRASA